MAPEKKLDQKKLDSYKKLLDKLKADLQHDIKNMSDANNDGNSGDVSGHVQHMADVATDMYDKEFNLGLASHDRELLLQIEEALERIKEGTYGLCLGTGKPISQARLKAIPYAKYSLKHQEELEEKGEI